MSNVTNIGAYQRIQDIRTPRTQREAGSDHTPLEHSRPIEPYWKGAALALGLIIGICIVVFLLDGAAAVMNGVLR